MRSKRPGTGSRRPPVEDWGYETGLLSYSQKDLDRLTARLSGHVTLPGEAKYNDDRMVFMHTYQSYPQIIIHAETETDVAEALRFAREIGLKVAVRSGGHSTAGFSMNDQVVIDVSSLDHVEIDTSDTRRPVAKVGPGTQFHKLNRELHGHRVNGLPLHVPGGGCETVAVGGYMMGGGYGFTSRFFGMNCDSVIGARMVTADGRVLSLSHTENADLFWAIRGGTGNQFGVLTEISYKLRTLGRLWGFGLKWPLNSENEQAKAAVAIRTMQEHYTCFPSARSTVGMQGLLVRIPTPENPEGQEPHFLIRGMYKPEEEDRGGDLEGGCQGALAPLLDQLDDREAQVEIWRSGHYLDLNQILLQTATEPHMDLPEVSLNTKPLVDGRIIHKLKDKDDWLKIVQHFVSAPDRTSFMALETYGGKINDFDPDATAYFHRRASLDLFAWAFWTFDKHEDAGRAWLADFGKIAGEMSNGFRYQNYPLRGNTNFRKEYFGDNFADLLKVKRKYDPENLFEFEQSLTPDPAPSASEPVRSPDQETGVAPLPARKTDPRRLVGLFFDPPMALARVGGADEPVDAYTWCVHPNAHHGLTTAIQPATSLRAVPCGDEEPGYRHHHHHRYGDDPDRPGRHLGRARAYRLETFEPSVITFKDARDRIRPVAPFFALCAHLHDGVTGETVCEPLTERLLAGLGLQLSDLHFRATAANRKAQARTGLASCAAIADVAFRGDDSRPHALNAISPHTEGEVPLVGPDNPLPLGYVQTFQPGDSAPLDQIRVRFVPGLGESYGPKEADRAPASPLGPGGFEPSQTEAGRIHKITRRRNRILASDTPWLGYNFREGTRARWPTPIDSYDGARVGAGRGWGVIDDTCDLAIVAELVTGGRRVVATARAFAGPPDFAPDRRPFYSIRDELDDRELPRADPREPGVEDVICDVFARIFETASLLNLDQRRAWALNGNAGMMGSAHPDDPDWDAGASPRLGPLSMRAADAPYADLVPEYTADAGDRIAPPFGLSEGLPYTHVAHQAHARMSQRALLKSFLARRPGRLRQIVRPPFARLADLPRHPALTDTPEVPGKAFAAPGDPEVRYRDPRNIRDQLYDMRMPPYMRHSMGVPLSITRRHYNLLLDWLEIEPPEPDANAETKKGKSDA